MLTQKELANRTKGLVSKKALVNYETGYRPIRIDVLKIILDTLDEDMGDFLLMADLVGSTARSVTAINVRRLLENRNPELHKLRRWWRAGHQEMTSSTDERINLVSKNVLTTLATVLNMTVEELVVLLDTQGLLIKRTR